MSKQLGEGLAGATRLVATYVDRTYDIAELVEQCAAEHCVKVAPHGITDEPSATPERSYWLLFSSRNQKNECGPRLRK